MNQSRWQRIDDLFGQAVELPAADREAFLVRECGDDAELRVEVDSLLASDDGAEAALGGAVGRSARRIVVEGLIGERLGSYRITALIGEGGMGSVYRAERDDGEYRSTVAIKVLQQGFGSAQAIARFRDERQILAALDHPGIVRLLDGGTTRTGQPYLVMEHIDGLPLSHHARERGLDVRGRIELVLRVCAPLAYAHARHVVHRDLKPGNILVGRDGPKLLDFGIAKLVDPDTSEQREARTRTGVVLLTPEYASPEQARAEPVTAASDIYSLGCVLYELLTGRPPLELTGDTLERLRTVCEVEPQRPSSIAPDNKREIRPFDDVVLRALRKRPEDRYASIDELARDLEAVLAGGVVRAPGRRRWWPWLLAVPVAATLVFALVPRGGSSPRARTVQLSTRAVASDDAWLATASDRMLRRRFDDLEAKKFAIVDGAADVAIELAVRHDAQGVVVDGGLGVPAVSAPSLASALDKLVPSLVTAIGGEVEVGPSDADVADMRLLNTTSHSAYRIYRLAALEFSRAIWIDTARVAELCRQAIAIDPAWAHPRVLLADALGLTTPDAVKEIELALKLIDRQRDPSGAAMLDAVDRARRGDYAGGADLLEPWFTKFPDDLSLGAALQQMYRNSSRYQDAIALDRQLRRRWPELQFGGNLIHDLRITGRDAEADREVQRWVVEAPSSEQAWSELAHTEAQAGHADLAERAARRLLLVYGESTERLITLCDALILAGKYQQASEIAERMRRADRIARARSGYRLGVIAVFEGRFAAAYEMLLTSLDENRPLGVESELTQILVLLRGLAPFAGDAPKARAFTQVLVDTYTNFGFGSNRAAATYELALFDRGKTCPDREPMLALVPDEQGRRDARRHITRAAAAVGCASCADAVREGMTSDEYSTGSLLALGLCGIDRGELVLAQQALERASRMSFGLFAGEASPFHALLARFHLAGVLARTGDTGGARREYTAFLGAWGNADRPIPEVAQARDALAKLPP